MFQLVRLTVINWYLMQAKSIPIGRLTAVIGANGSGKTAILDAIQVCMLGGDHNAFKLNPLSTAKRTGDERSVRGYMLGQIGSSYAKRKSAQTYLVLGFRNDVTDRVLSIGLALKTTENDPDEKIEARFIARGPRLLDVDDFSHAEAGRFTVFDWRQVKSTLEAEKFEIDTAAKAKEFRQMYARHLNPSRTGTAGFEDARFVRIFKQALEFQQDRMHNVSAFMREQILPIDALPVDTWRDQHKNWQAMLTRIKLAEAEKDRVLEIWAGAREQYEAEIGLSAVEWLEIFGPFTKSVRDFLVAKSQIRLNELKRNNAVESLAHWAARKAQVEQDINDKKELIANSPAAAKVRAFKEAERRIDGELMQAEGTLLRYRALLRELPPHIANARVHGASVRVADDAAVNIEKLVNRDLADIGAWKDLFTQYEKIRNSPLLERITSSFQEASKAAGESKTRLEAAQRRQQLLKSNKIPVPPAAERLLEAIRSKTIGATTVSAKLDLKPEFREWREVVEAILGRFCHAILVAPKDVEVAIGIMRRLKSPIPVIRTNQIQDKRGRPADDSLAHVVTSDDPLAMAFAVDRLGHIKRVTLDEELASVPFAATVDGGFSSRLTSEMRRLDSERQLFGDRRLVEDDRGAVRSATQEAEESSKAFEELDRARTKLAEARDKIPATIEDWDGLFRSVETKRLEKAANATSLVQAENEIDPGLSTRLAELGQELTGVKEALEAEGTIKGNAETEIARQTAHRDIAKKGVGELRNRLIATRTKLRAVDIYLEAVQVGGKRIPKIRRLGGTERRKALDTMKQEFDAARHKAEGKFQAARDAYLKHHEAKGMPSTGVERVCLLRDYAIWSEQRMDAIEKDALQPYRTQAREAADLFLRTTRTAFLDHIQARVQLMEKIRRELNANLAKREFNGMIYQISATQAADLKDYLDLAQAASKPEGTPALSMDFIEANPEHEQVKVVREMMRVLTAEVSDEDPLKKLVDYRNYYDFDIDMYNAMTFEGVTKSKPVEIYSKRRQNSSVGERVTPFYACMAVAMAMTYFGSLSPTDHAAKAGLVIFDEAFHGLDQANVEKIVSFYRDIGLQLICLSQEDRRPLFAMLMDKMIMVIRRQDVNGFRFGVDEVEVTKQSNDLLRRTMAGEYV